MALNVGDILYTSSTTLGNPRQHSRMRRQAPTFGVGKLAPHKQAL